MTTGMFVYCFINVFAWMGIVILCFGLGETWRDYLIYPILWNALDKKDINTAGKIIVLTLQTLLTFPAIILSYVVLITYFITRWTCKLFCKIFKKRG